MEAHEPDGCRYKTEVVRRRGPRHHLQAVELATLECVEWFDGRRFLTSIGDVPPPQYEQHYYAAQEAQVMMAGVN